MMQLPFDLPQRMELVITLEYRGTQPGLNRFRDRGPVAQQAVQPKRVVLLWPMLDQDLGLKQRVKCLYVQ